MSFLFHNILGLLVLLLAVGVLSFGLKFSKLTIYESGENISPFWFHIVRPGCAVLALIIVMMKLDLITEFLLKVVFICFLSFTNFFAVIIFAIIAVAVFTVFGNFGVEVRNKAALPYVKYFVRNDKIVDYLKQDIERGAREIKIYQNGASAIRSFGFDVDGINHPSYSATGALLIALYLNSFFDNRFYVEAISNIAGVGRISQLNVLNNGRRYKFSHVLMTDTIPENKNIETIAKDTDVSKLGLSSRTVTYLQRGGINNYGQVTKLSIEDIEMMSFHKTDADEIFSLLQNQGYQIKYDETKRKTVFKKVED